MSGNRPSGGKVSNFLVSAAVSAHMHSSTPCTPSSFQDDMMHTRRINMAADAYSKLTEISLQVHNVVPPALATRKRSALLGRFPLVCTCTHQPTAAEHQHQLSCLRCLLPLTRVILASRKGQQESGILCKSAAAGLDHVAAGGCVGALFDPIVAWQQPSVRYDSSRFAPLQLLPIGG